MTELIDVVCAFADRKCDTSCMAYRKKDYPMHPHWCARLENMEALVGEN